MFYDAKQDTFVPKPCPKCKNTTVVTSKKQKDSPYQISCSSCGHSFGYFCPICPSSFPKKGLLETHFEVHDNLLKTYYCKDARRKKSTCCIESCKHKLIHNTSLLHHQNHVLQHNASLSLKKRQSEVQERQQNEIQSKTNKKMQPESQKHINSPPNIESEDENESENDEITFIAPQDDEEIEQEDSNPPLFHNSHLLQDDNLLNHIEKQNSSTVDEEEDNEEEENILSFNIPNLKNFETENEKRKKKIDQELQQQENEDENDEKEDKENENLPQFVHSDFNFDDPASYFTKLSENLTVLTNHITFPKQMLPEMKKLQQIVQETSQFKHEFKFIVPKLTVLFDHLKNLPEMDRDSFELYFSLSHQKVKNVVSLIQRHLRGHNSILGQDYNWYKKMRALLQEPTEKNEDGESYTSFLRRIQKILSKNHNNLQIKPSKNKQDFSSSLHFQRLFEYCQNVGKDVFPLVFLFWRDDLQLFNFSQVNSASYGGCFFKILNFSQELQHCMGFVNIFSLTKPKNQKIYYTISEIFNELFTGIVFDGLKLIPFFALNLGDNPEKYDFVQSTRWSTIKPCNSCLIDIANLPFGYNFLKTDSNFLDSISAAMEKFSIYYPHFEDFFKHPSKTNAQFYRSNYFKFLRFHKSLSEACGHEFIQYLEFPKEQQELIEKYFPKQGPSSILKFHIPPFLLLVSYWKGLYPIYFCNPHEPFHTLLNVMRSHLKFLIKKNCFDLPNFVKEINNKIKEEKETRKEDKDFQKHAIVYSVQLEKWHGDHYFNLLKRKEAVMLVVSNTKQEEKSTLLKLFVLLAILKKANSSQLIQYKIYNKFFLWRNSISEVYESAIKLKITFHHLEHLIQQIHYLGPADNFNGQMCERKNKEVGERIREIFGGGSVSEQVVRAETCKENMQMCFYEQQPKKILFVIEDWLSLVSEW